jgi:hypothetical protein
MTNYILHKDAGIELTRTEDNATDRHYLEGQAADDVVYAADATHLAGLPVAASRIVGKKASGALSALTGAETLAICSGQAGAAFSMNSQRISSIGAPSTAGDALVKGTRFTTAELPDGTLNYVLAAQGTGVSPAYAALTSLRNFSSVASDNVAFANDAEVTTSSTAYVKVKEILAAEIPYGTIRVAFDLKSAAGATVYGKTYRNGVAIGAEHTQGVTSYATKTDDFTCTPPLWNNGDLIQVYSKATAGETAYVKNFRFCYNLGLRQYTQDP